MQKPIYSVGQVNHYIRRMFEQDILLNFLYVRGEVSNCKYHSTGHIYFSLKDTAGAMNCVMFRGDRKGLAFPMKDGDKVVIGGTVDIYEKTGSYQLYAKDIKLEGAGLLYERFLKLKAELSEMGMFDPLYKKPIPRYASRVGVITAPTGAAVRDIQSISKRRNPYVQLILYPALVQGEGAAASLCRALAYMDTRNLDVIIIGRGGGSYEDLWAFNEEEVARAIFNCQTPVISAVGHETDTTIADYVADLRAPTPSAAAELAVFDIREFDAGCAHVRQKLNAGMQRHLTKAAYRTKQLKNRFELLSPVRRLRDRRQRLMHLEESLERAMIARLEAARRRHERTEEMLTRRMEQKLQNRSRRFGLILTRFKGLNPLDRLKAGYAYVATPSGRALRSVKDISENDELKIHAVDGVVTARVEAVQERGKNNGIDK
ncbi:MAG: exodeoxyribonuclease VII large subunit [Lachnospiraceae bacterium]|nr:exodeoxyribonuclease VII large subunit [Lachnospiraceae bacterium]